VRREMSATQTKATKERELIGKNVIGDCAECGAVQNAKLTVKDVELAEGEMMNEFGEPGCVYRFCDECYTNQATILLH
jgi:hypothetical protein